MRIYLLARRIVHLELVVIRDRAPISITYSVSIRIGRAERACSCMRLEGRPQRSAREALPLKTRRRPRRQLVFSLPDILLSCQYCCESLPPSRGRTRVGYQIPPPKKRVKSAHRRRIKPGERRSAPVLAFAPCARAAIATHRRKRLATSAVKTMRSACAVPRGCARPLPRLHA